MGQLDLNSKYQRLRQELERAYAAPVWNSQQIDRIADELVRTERALARVWRLAVPGLREQNAPALCSAE